MIDLKKELDYVRRHQTDFCEKVYELSVSVSDTTGDLKRYMSEEELSYSQTGVEARIYGDFMHCFLRENNEVILLTAFLFQS